MFCFVVKAKERSLCSRSQAFRKGEAQNASRNVLLEKEIEIFSVETYRPNEGIHDVTKEMRAIVLREMYK
jgi:hypothetical protein